MDDRVEIIDLFSYVATSRDSKEYTKYKVTTSWVSYHILGTHYHTT